MMRMPKRAAIVRKPEPQHMTADELRVMLAAQKPNKLHARKTVVDDIVFDSGLEANRYKTLKLMERAGQIRDLRLQVPFLLQDHFRDRTGKMHRAIKYVSDFVYEEKTITGWHLVVEDSKGMKTPMFRLKWKLLLHKYPTTDFRVVK